MRPLLISILLFSCAACTVDEGVDPSEKTGDTDIAGNASNGENGQSSSSNSTAEEPISVTVTPVDTGLFPDPVDTAPVVLDASQSDTAEAGIYLVELPAGVFELTIERESGAVRPVADRALTGLEGTFSLSPTGNARFFNPHPDRVQLRIDGDHDLTISRSLASNDETTGARPTHAHTVGPAFDSYLDNPSTESASQLLADLRHAGGTPIQLDDFDLFVAPTSEGDTPSIRGSFNNWTGTPESEIRPLADGIGLRYLRKFSGRQAYKITYGDVWTTDRANRHVEWDGIETNSTGGFNSVIRPDLGASRLEWWPQFHSSRLGNGRDVFIYLPREYGTSSHPLLIAHDGNESLVRGRFHEVIDAWSANRPAAERPVVAFVALNRQDERIDDYTFATPTARGDAYADFLALTLLPELRAQFDVRTDRSATGLVGASLGGLISYYVRSRHSETFGYTAGMSSSFFWENEAMLQIVDAEGCMDADYYLDSGSPADNYEVTLRMRNLLDALGCRYRYVLDEGGTHDWWKWNERLPGVLDHFAEVSR